MYEFQAVDVNVKNGAKKVYSKMIPSSLANSPSFLQARKFIIHECRTCSMQYLGRKNYLFPNSNFLRE